VSAAAIIGRQFKSGSQERTQGREMTTLSLSPQPDKPVLDRGSHARALSLAGRGRLARTSILVAALLAFVLAAFFADRASALTTAANCALPGSTFQGGDGNQNTPTLAEQTFCTEHLLPTSRDWHELSNVTNSQDPQAQDSTFSGGTRRARPAAGDWKTPLVASPRGRRTSSAAGARPTRSRLTPSCIWRSSVPPRPATRS